MCLDLLGGSEGLPLLCVGMEGGEETFGILWITEVCLHVSPFLRYSHLDIFSKSLLLCSHARVRPFHYLSPSRYLVNTSIQFNQISSMKQHDKDCRVAVLSKETLPQSANAEQLLDVLRSFSAAR